MQPFLLYFQGFFMKPGAYGNRTHRELCSNPPLVLKTRAPTRGANTPEVANALRIQAGPAAHKAQARLAPGPGAYLFSGPFLPPGLPTSSLISRTQMLRKRTGSPW